MKGGIKTVCPPVPCRAALGRAFLGSGRTRLVLPQELFSALDDSDLCRVGLVLQQVSSLDLVEFPRRHQNADRLFDDGSAGKGRSHVSSAECGVMAPIAVQPPVEILGQYRE